MPFVYCSSVGSVSIDDSLTFGTSFPLDLCHNWPTKPADATDGGQPTGPVDMHYDYGWRYTKFSIFLGSDTRPSCSPAVTQHLGPVPAFSPTSGRPACASLAHASIQYTRAMHTYCTMNDPQCQSRRCADGDGTLPMNAFSSVITTCVRQSRASECCLRKRLLVCITFSHSIVVNRLHVSLLCICEGGELSATIQP